MQQELDSQQPALHPRVKAKISPLCLGCKFEELLRAKQIDLSANEDWEQLANQWGEQPLRWLHRCLTGEVSWIPHVPFIYVLELMDVAPGSPQEIILTALNQRNFYRRGGKSLNCSKHAGL